MSGVPAQEIGVSFECLISWKEQRAPKGHLQLSVRQVLHMR